MKVDGTHRRSLWPADGRDALFVIDQRRLPHECVVARLEDLAAVDAAICQMTVRGAPLIGATAAYGVALQMNADAGDAALDLALQRLAATRPTAVNLRWALERQAARLRPLAPAVRADAAWDEADAIADADVAVNRALGAHGLALLRTLQRQHAGRRLNLLTHCNAGWLATVDWGTALAPVYLAQAAGLDLHLWVDETRPRNQGASLTAWELGQQGVAHTLVADNAGGHLMQRGLVDAVIVGCDRVSARGDVANKIGTYLKALAARDNGVPFWVAMPLSTLDRRVSDGLRDIPIEQRDAREVTHLGGRGADGVVVEVQLAPDGTSALNPAFDVTPARLVDALITERGVVPATAEAIAALTRAAPGPADDG
ncbi:S-methyl-5-thioribose-1-phosphate isomerase [Azohydromonas sp.]|uniref:S-methyl-5-thioribose-1-phosphate isomerase n=1 Tax=Azohydromonas sp. TaxID=1872666 RepID=UPI002B694986|nr:S-methyl-5-thioribose-1-phosphate isomerase [Azohydromonas sp.]HMM86002.1 S-methyl-5-thioribose-1-phosphate isomerase [Azohydromonas sp.]